MGPKCRCVRGCIAAGQSVLHCACIVLACGTAALACRAGWLLCALHLLTLPSTPHHNATRAACARPHLQGSSGHGDTLKDLVDNITGKKKKKEKSQE